MSNETTDEERREAYGWCPKCGAGNDREGYAHLSTCPTLRPQTTGYLVATHSDGRLIQYIWSTEEERECLLEWIFAELEEMVQQGRAEFWINEYSGVASVQDG